MDPWGRFSGVLSGKSSANSRQGRGLVRQAYVWCRVNGSRDGRKQPPELCGQAAQPFDRSLTLPAGVVSVRPLTLGQCVDDVFATAL
jgi:hypothetical protein